MEQIVLRNAKVVTLDGRCDVADVNIEGGRITDVGGEAGGAEKFDLSGATLFPGFIDIHCHGAAGVDVNSASGTGIGRVSEFLCRHGIAGWVPTLVPDSIEAYGQAVAAIDSEMLAGRSAARVLGVHYEGVFASLHRCGALRPQHFREASEGFMDLPVPSAGARLTTLAPEIEGGSALVSSLVREGWIVAIGHSEANADVLESAFEAGARHVTHLFNAMTGIHHRDPGVAGWAITRSGVTFDVIADGRHVDPSIVSMAVSAKGADSSILISDSVAPTGLGDGEYSLWGNDLLVRNGEAVNSNGNLSGSVITMLDAVNLSLSLGFTPGEVALMASSNPARLLGIQDEAGSIEAGKRADLTAIRDGKCILTMVGGTVVHEAI